MLHVRFYLLIALLLGPSGGYQAHETHESRVEVNRLSTLRHRARIASLRLHAPGVLDEPSDELVLHEHQGRVLLLV